jgi:type IV fimbrial biogenesis protein FimT
VLGEEEGRRVLMRHAPQAGFSLIELMVGITIMALLIMIGLPNMAIWLNNTQIRTTGETMLAGLTLARTEAVKRNQIVRFQMVSDLTSGCSVASNGKSWVVSLDDPTSACDTAPSDAVAPRIIQSRSGSEGTERTTVAGIVAGTTVPATTVFFNGLGRLTSPGGATDLTQIDITNPVGGTCENSAGTGGPMRCLRINISLAGAPRMCDPVVTDATDPRRC